jgi:hypothetical protein
MSFGQTIPKDTNHSTSKLRFFELEELLKKYEELFKTVESHAEQLNELKNNQVTIIIDLFVVEILIFYFSLINKELNERRATTNNKLDDAKNELRGFTSLYGFSTVLKTSNPFIKVLWVFLFLILFSSLVQNSIENINDYYQYTVITKIEYVNENPMTLPAVTVCLASSQTGTTNATLEESLFMCRIGKTECDIKDFYSFEARMSYSNDILPCYVLNGGRNSSGHLSEIKSTRATGYFSGFELELNLPIDHFLFYFINEAFVEPTSSEIVKSIYPGKTHNFIYEKTVETKLKYPFNNCWERENLPDTTLVRQLSATNITYRQINCFEVCFQDFVRNYALEHELSENEAKEKEIVNNYDRVRNCDHLCPLECESIQYKISQSTYSLSDLGYYEKYLSSLIPLVEKKLNITVNSTDEFSKNYLDLVIVPESLKYTKISQTPKTSLSALISNLGGSTGLFLDLSFISVCRAIEFFLGVIFKF